MFANRKKALFIALAGLLASSTAVAVLTFQSGSGVDPNAPASGSTSQAVPGQLENVDVAGNMDEALALYHPTSEPGQYLDALSLPVGSNEAPNSGSSASIEKPVANSATPAEVVEQSNGAAATPSSLDEGSSGAAYPTSPFGRQLLAFGGGGNLSGLHQPSQPGASLPEDPLTNVEPPAPSDTNSQRPDPISVGTDPQDGGCDVLIGCGSLADPPGSGPGSDTPNGEPPAATPVPEPGSVGLLGVSLALIALMGRRRRVTV